MSFMNKYGISEVKYMNILIAGCGRVGSTIAALLSNEGHEITVMDTSNASLEKVTNSTDVMGFQGDCTGYTDQLNAGIEDADLFIAVTNNDEKNMLSCLMAHKTGHCHTVARIKSPRYSDEILYLKEELGLSMSINPERAAADEITRLIQIPSALEVDTFAKGKTSLIALVVPEKSPLDRLIVKDFPSKIASNALVCVVRRGNEVIIPDGNFVLMAKDKISISIALDKVRPFLNKVGIKSKPVKNVLLAGGGTISYYLAKKLIDMHVSVKIIEKDLNRCELLSEKLPSAIIINADATDKEVLTEEAFENMDVICSLMNDDEDNIMLSYYCRKKTKAKLITRIRKPSFDDIIGDMDIGVIISTRKITAEYITKYVRSMYDMTGSDVETLYTLQDGLAEALEINVKRSGKATGIPLKDLPLKQNTLLCCISRGKKIIRPTGKDTIEPGDSVVLVTTQKGLKSIDDIIRM